MSERKPPGDPGEKKDQREQVEREEAQRDEPRTDRENDAAAAARQKGPHKPKQDDK